MSGIELNSVSCIPKAQFNPASLTGSFQAMNGTGFDDDIKIFQMYNGSTTVSIDISLDGVTAHSFIPPLGTLIIDFQTNHSDISGSGTKYGQKGQIIWGRTATQPTWLQMIGWR